MNRKNYMSGEYETPTTALLDVVAEGMLCISLKTELETYDYLDEQSW